MTNLTVTPAEQLQRCKDNEQIWREVHPSSQSTTVRSVNDAVDWINTMTAREGTNHLQVLVCGSLHLVGAVMTSLDITNDYMYEL